MKKLLLPTHFNVYLLISVVFHFVLPWGRIIRPPYKYFGILFMLAGIVVTLRVDSLLKKRKTTVKPDEKPSFFITSGLYRFSRNPMYFGMTLILFGVALLLGSIAAFMGPVFFIVAMDRLFIPQEETKMHESFGDEYEAYKKKVRRWI